MTNQFMMFRFKHEHTGEIRTVTLNAEQIQEMIADELNEKLAADICQCEPIGETNVVECNCDSYYEHFALLPQTDDEPSQANEACLALAVWQAVPCMYHMVHKKHYRRVGKTTFWWNHRTKAWSISREGEFQLAAHFGGAS